jgi:prepilin-type N-terminal cleavage/methylation domain-containing protein
MHLSALHRLGRRLAKRLAPQLRDERGFTLIEVLVATAAAVIVTAAMGSIVIATVHFNANFTDRVDANQEGRTALETIETALNSSCVASGVAPIISGGTTGPTGNLANSDDSHIWFYTAVAPGTPVSDLATINPSLVEVYLSGNQLMETAYPWLSGTAPEPTNANPWTFNWATPTNFTLLPEVTYSAPAGSTGTTGATGPIFQYYGYNTGVTGATGTISSTPYTTPLSAANAASTAEVLISFRALPADDWNAAGRASDISDSVVLRLTPASSQSAATNSPCS